MNKLIVFFLLIISVNTSNLCLGQVSYLLINYDNSKTSLLKVKDSLNAIEIINETIDLYHSKGYVFAYSANCKFNNDTIAVEINKGLRPKVKVLDVNTNGIRSDNTSLLYKINGKKFNNNRLNKLKNETIRYYEDNGYPFAVIYTDSFIVENNSLAFLFNIEQGNYYKFDTLRILGEIKISNRFIEKYTGIIKGGAYSEKKIKDINIRIGELGFIEQARPVDIWFGENSAAVNLYLKNNKANQFFGIIGIMPEAGNEGKTVVTGDVDLLLINSLRHADRIELRWKKHDNFGQVLETGFLYPYIFNYPLGIDFKFKLLKKDTTYINTNSIFTLPYYFKGSNSLGVFYEKRTTTVLSKNFEANSNMLFADVDLNALGLSFNYKRIDRLLIPRKGIEFNTAFLSGKKKSNAVNIVNDNKSADFYEFTNSLVANYPLSNYLGVKFNFSSGFMGGANLFDNELFKLGGYSSLRGFDEESILATSYMIANIELKAFIDEYSNTFIFINSAYYEKNNLTNINDSPIGIGWGLDIQTQAGIISLIYSLGKQFDNSFDFRSSKIHIGLINRF